jgi:hypothetical protein
VLLWSLLQSLFSMWSYSGFNEFRARLLYDAGYAWNDVITSRKEDPLFALLNHSDCEGFIEIVDCAHLAECLLRAVNRWRTMRMAQRSNPALLKPVMGNRLKKPAKLNRTRVQRIPSRPRAVAHKKAGYIRADLQCHLIFRLQNGGGPYMEGCAVRSA